MRTKKKDLLLGANISCTDEEDSILPLGPFLAEDMGHSHLPPRSKTGRTGGNN